MGRHHQAVVQYQRLVSWLEMEYGNGAEQQHTIQDLLLTSHLNLALCYLRMNELTQVVENCNKVSGCLTPERRRFRLLRLHLAEVTPPSLCPVLSRQVIEFDKNNEKALYRRGEARLLRNEFSLAMADFLQVLQVNPANRAARAQISICQGQIKEYHEKDKKTYANMFQKFAEWDAKVCKQNVLGESAEEDGLFFFPPLIFHWGGLKFSSDSMSEKKDRLEHTNNCQE